MGNTEWLLESGEPRTRYRTPVDLLGQSRDDPKAQEARTAMLAHPQVQGLVAEAAGWPGHPLKRHDGCGHHDPG